jgi:pyruvate dehydrogenase E1 component
MFFQRTLDQLWAFGDIRGRGFVLGATAGRTTLNGEGLQHEDGHSHLFGSAVPNLRAYDPAFAYEVATIIREGLKRMYVDREDAIYYMTLYNQDYPMPPMPAGSEEGILAGLYLFRGAVQQARHRAQILGSGVILLEALRAQEILAEKYEVAADVWSATSYQQLRDEALTCERWNRLHPAEKRRVPFVTRALEGAPGPVVAATDFVKLVPEMVARWMPRGFTPLGTDGFGRSDTRAALRRFFEVDAEHIVVAVLAALSEQGQIAPAVVTRAIQDFGIGPDYADPWRQ